MSKSTLPPLPPEKGEWDEKAVSRRGFLEAIFGVLASLGALAVGVPGLRFLAGNSLVPPIAKWVELGKAAELPVGRVHRVNYSTRATDAWREVTKKGAVYIFSKDGGTTFMALDATCTHLGCMVQWKEDDQRYACPCHAGYFTQEGQVISGPPPRPLRQLPVKIENGVVYAEI